MRSSSLISWFGIHLSWCCKSLWDATTVGPALPQALSPSQSLWLPHHFLCLPGHTLLFYTQPLQWASWEDPLLLDTTYRKLRYGKADWLTESQTISKQQRQDFNPRYLEIESILLIVTPYSRQDSHPHPRTSFVGFNSYMLYLSCCKMVAFRN